MTKPIVISLDFVYDPDAGEVRLAVPARFEEEKAIVIRKKSSRGADVTNRAKFTDKNGKVWEYGSMGCVGYGEDGCELGDAIYDLIKDKSNT